MKINHKIPTFEEAKLITENNSCFTHRIREVGGYKVSIFDYMLATHSDFLNPIENSGLNALELRGLCFVHDPNTSEAKRYILLHKFFNVNQTKDSQFHDLENLPIKKISNKLDGSVMRFIRLPDGKIVVKSKTFFDNEQTSLATMYYNSQPKLQDFVRETLDNNLCAVFELTSRELAIVVKYKKTSLTLIQLRDEETGEYLDIHDNDIVKKHGVDVVEDETKIVYDLIDSEKSIMTLSDLMKLKEELQEDKEGWVVEYEKDLFKVKLNLYCTKHKTKEALQKEDLVMHAIINNEIDDIIGDLELSDLRRIAVEAIEKAYSRYYSGIVNKTLQLYKKYKEESLTKKEYFAKYSGEEELFIAIKVIQLPEEDAFEKIKKMVKDLHLKETYYLTKAKNFIEKKLKSKLLMQFELGED